MLPTIILEPRPTVFACDSLEWLQCGVGFPLNHPEVLHDLNNALAPSAKSLVPLLDRQVECSKNPSPEIDWGGQRIWVETCGKNSVVEDLGGLEETFQTSTRGLLDCLRIVLGFRKEKNEVRTLAKQAWHDLEQGLRTPLQRLGNRILLREGSYDIHLLKRP